MTDPYIILGVSRQASSDEIKKAYRKMSRIYHPDANVNNPNKDKAEEKFKEIQAAYNQIMDEREHGYSGGYQSETGGFGKGFSGESVQMQAAVNFINNRQYAQALNVLNGISDHNARWYYVHAYANYGLGNVINAVEDARRAVQMEPNNMEYQNLLRQLEAGGSWYRGMGNEYGRPSGGAGNCCMQLLCLEMLFNCCCCSA